MTPARQRPPPIRLSSATERWVYALAFILLLSGGLWLLFEYCVRMPGTYGPERHFAQAWFLKLHGFIALFAVWGFGTLWTFHVRRAWDNRKHRRSGGVVFVATSALAISGVLLYYVGNDFLRSVLSLAHWAMGFAAAVALSLHAIWGRRLRRRVPAAADS